jgi:hypothetical protein
MNKWCTVLLLVSFLAGLPGNAAAYPIPPVTLWQLIEQSDAVVLARVERIEKAEPIPIEKQIQDGDFFDRDSVVLRVLETWKGEEMAEIRVTYGAGWICPAPPRYVEGEVVLAFLEAGERQVLRRRVERAQYEAEKLLAPPPSEEELAEQEKLMEEYGVEPPTPEEEAEQEARSEASLRRYEAWAPGRWFTVGLSYGTLYPAEEDRPVFRELVAQAVRLQAADTFDPDDKREWLISAAERRATRWQGLYELQPKTDRLHYFYDSERRGAEADAPLTGEELDRLAAGFVREPSVDPTLSMLLGLLAPLPDAGVDRAAAAAIETALETRGRAWWLPSAMAHVLRRFGDPDPAHRLTRENLDCSGQPVCEEVDSEALPGIWQQARRDLGIPEVARAEVPERRVFGVGGETPD